MQSERIEQRALHKCEQRSHPHGIQQELLILSFLLPCRPDDGTRIGGGICGCVSIRRGKGDVRIPGALSDVRNMPVLVARGHAPAAKDALNLLRRCDIAKVEEHRCAQGFRTEELFVSGERQGAQAAGWMKEESRHMVHLPESRLKSKPRRSAN
jgi:hypothetical protein